jgi:eukaryotic-like serine/threonine-protein kinase
VSDPSARPEPTEFLPLESADPSSAEDGADEQFAPGPGANSTAPSNGPADSDPSEQESSDPFSSTWTLFCVGCNERFPCSEKGNVCPNCGHHCTFSDTSNDDTIVSGIEDNGAIREVAHKSTDTDPLIGRLLRCYQCVSLLGSGGMGRVYLATHTDLHRKCALKILSPKRAVCDQDYVDRFTQEGRSAAALSHPNIVTVHAVGSEDGHHFLEMEYIAGRSLQQVITDDGPLPITRALVLAARIADGLAAAHRERIIHRDIKPDNIMMTLHGVPKISDFGLAKRVLDARGRPVADGICGTPNFMAPELFQGEHASPASDVYALGVCLYLMLTGRLPYRAETLAQLRWKGSSRGVPNVREVRREVPLDVAEIIAQLTSATPGNRPKDAIAASQLLHAILGHERDVESLLIEAFKHNQSVTWQRNGEQYVLTVCLPGERCQTVFIEQSDHEVNNRLLLFYSVCCHAEPEYYEQALRLNSQMAHGSLALREIDGHPHFVVVDTYPRATVDPEEVRRSVLDIAHNADHVEQLLTGQDLH